MLKGSVSLNSRGDAFDSLSSTRDVSNGKMSGFKYEAWCIKPLTQLLRVF